MPKRVEGVDTSPVGTGPFVFGSYEPNRYFTLNAYPDYYEEGLPYLSSVTSASSRTSRR